MADEISQFSNASKVDDGSIYKQVRVMDDSAINANSHDALMDLGIDYSEIALDTFLNDGVVKEIPIIKTVVSLFKTGRSINDYYSLKKLAAFLNGCHGLSEEQVQKFMEKLGSEKKRKDIGTKILFIVDRVDAVEKAELIGRALKLLVTEQIGLPFYFRLCHMIDKSFYDDIEALTAFQKDDTIITSTNPLIPAHVLEELFSSGFISDFGFDGGDFKGQNEGTRFGLNEFGRAIKSIL